MEISVLNGMNLLTWWTTGVQFKWNLIHGIIQVLDSYKYYCFQHTMEVIKVEPDLDAESLNRSPIFEDPRFEETEDRDQDPLLIKSAEVKQEVKVSVLLVHALCKGVCTDRFSLIRVTLITKLTFYCYV
jgi:hypothetical protein